jgi:uncharacterized protein YggE
MLVLGLVLMSLTQAAISVLGTGSVLVNPDRAVISLLVESTSQEASEAMQTTSSLIAAIRSGLLEEPAGDTDEFNTAQFTLNPKYRYPMTGDGSPVLEGYTASHGIDLVVKDIDNAGSRVDALVRFGGSAVRINGIRFEVSNQTTFEDEALQLAVKDAVRKADLMAAAAGLCRGKLVSVSSVPVSRGPIPFAPSARAEAVPLTSFEQASQAIIAEVQASFESESCSD